MFADLSSLPSDTFARIGGVAALVRGMAGHGERLSVVDVGGHPGLVAQQLAEHLVITADIFNTGPRGYIKASGAALPFGADAVDIAVATDVLEHVPPEFRTPVLAEMTRVARRAVIVGGPYSGPAVEMAENSIRRMAPDVSQCARWLREHKENGLPDIRETGGELEQAGFEVRVLHGAGVVEWYLLQALAVQAEESVEIAGALQNFFRQYNVAAESGSTTQPAYRHVLVAVKNAALLPGSVPLKDWPAVDEGSPADTTRLEAVIALTEAVAGALGASRQGTSSVDLKYVEMLEQALAGRPLQAREPVKGGLLTRLLGRLGG